MKKLLFVLALLLMAAPAFAQDKWPLGQTRTSKFLLIYNGAGEESAGTSVTCDTYEDITSTPIIVAGAMSLMSGTTNQYYIQTAVTTGNGFEAGKAYNQICKATVGGLTTNYPNDYYRVEATETTTGMPAVDLRTIQKNVASQKLGIVFKNSSGSNVTGLATGSIACTVSKDFGAPATTNDTTEAEVGNGLYWIDLTQAETNADWLYFNCTGTGALDYSAIITTQH